MKLMSIDYGEKRVGIASTDEGGTFALPREVWANDALLIPKILKFKDEEKIEKIILGESKNLDQTENPIQMGINALKAELERNGAQVELHPELFTSAEAVRLQGANEMTDASAAALILKSYIDTHGSKV